LTPGFVGADIQALTEATGIAVNRNFEEENSIKQDPLNETELAPFSILMKDFGKVVKKVQPSANERRVKLNFS
jgi:SpoVK/Ycf46/Vps4 family AAA+-type ATPase